MVSGGEIVGADRFAMRRLLDRIDIVI